MKGLAKNLHFAVLALFLATYYLDYEAHLEEKANVEGRINPIRVKIKNNKKKLRELRSFEENLEESKKRVQEVAQQITKVQRQLPTAISDTEVLDYIASESGKINIKDMVLTPKAEELNGFYYAKQYDYEGKGTFLQFVVLFERIYNADRLFNIDSVSFEQGSTEFQKGRFHLISMKTEIESFRYNSDYKESTGIEDIENKYKSKLGRERGKSAKKLKNVRNAKKRKMK